MKQLDTLVMTHQQFQFFETNPELVFLRWRFTQMFDRLGKKETKFVTKRKKLKMLYDYETQKEPNFIQITYKKINSYQKIVLFSLCD